jgi:hypothetical protein
MKKELFLTEHRSYCRHKSLPTDLDVNYSTLYKFIQFLTRPYRQRSVKELSKIQGAYKLSKDFVT